MEDAGGIEGPAISYEKADKDWKKATAQGQSALDRTVAVLGPDVEVRLVPDDETTGAAIVRVAHEMNADVLVIGSSGKGWVSRLFGGSVSDYVVHHAPCPVMLDPPRRLIVEKPPSARRSGPRTRCSRWRLTHNSRSLITARWNA